MKNWILWISVIIGVIVIFQISYGLAVLRPSNINWLMSARHDWGTHYLGWAFYRTEPWHFPLGQMTNYNYPIGTNVGFTDSIPLLALFFKLFSPLLSSDFQYFGIWLFSCHLLIAYFTILILRLFKINRVITFAAAMLIAANPVLLHRGMHPALCAQWLLLACIYFYFLNPEITKPKRILVYQLIVLLLSALINPYLCMMVLGFTVATPAKLCFFDQVISKKYLAAYLAIALLSFVFTWYVTGMISFHGKEDLGVSGAYGLYSMNLNSLYNAGGFSAFTKSYPWVSWHQYEGFMYLGAGILLLILLLLVFRVMRFFKSRRTTEAGTDKMPHTNRRLIPLGILAALYAIFSITGIISWNSKVIARIPAPGFFIHLEEIFRACGRFFWTPYYLILLFTIISIARIKLKPPITTALVCVALVIQLFDIKSLLTFRNLPSGTYTPPMNNAGWMHIMSQFDEILFFPAFQSPGIRPMDYQDFSYLALKAGKPVNLAYVAREDLRASAYFSDSLKTTIENGSLSRHALYITNLANLERFALPLQKNTVTLNTLDSCYYIFSKSAKQDSLASLTEKLNAPYKAPLDSLTKILRTKTEFREIPKITDTASRAIRYFVQSSDMEPDVIVMLGWAFIDSTQNNRGDSVWITLSSDNKSYAAGIRMQKRPDVTDFFHKKYLDDAGFRLIGFTDQVPPGKYRLGMIIRDAQGRSVHEWRLTRGDILLPDYLKK